jgi:thioesterase domain-containing protein
MDLKQWIYQKIPAIKNFEFDIQSLKPGFINLRVPLKAHINHKGTAFGGSLYNSAVLACYLLVYSELKAVGESSDSFVISDGTMKYLKPVSGDFEVKVGWSQVQLDATVKALRAKKKARWTLFAEIECEGVRCAEFQGRFVLQVAENLS